MPGEAPVLLVFWESVLDDLLERTSRFPKAMRFTLTSRIDNLALDVLERLIEARYRRDRRPLLQAANLALGKLRVLLRLAHTRRLLDSGGLEHVARALDEAGRMVGGWAKTASPGTGT